jgi:phosphate starvation-inducible protein PhoH
MNDMELNSIMTRIGQRSKIIFAGDFRQSDLYTKATDKSGLQKFMVIAEMMPSFKIFEFTPEDIVRSELVKEYIIAREKYEQQYLDF